MAARKHIHDLVDAQIAGARARPRPDDHLLAMLINGRGEGGYALNDNEIRDSIVSLITAGYDTTSGALAWAIHTPAVAGGRVGHRPRGSASRARRSAARRGRPRLPNLAQRGRPRDASAVPARRRLRPQGDARPLVRRAPHPGGPIAGLQRVRHPPAARVMARANRIPAVALGPRRTGLPQARTARIHSVQRGLTSRHRSGPWPPPR
jgi:Cytochrome P450